MRIPSRTIVVHAVAGPFSSINLNHTKLAAPLRCQIGVGAKMWYVNSGLQCGIQHTFALRDLYRLIVYKNL